MCSPLRHWSETPPWKPRGSKRWRATRPFADQRAIHCDLRHDDLELDRGERLALGFEGTVRGFRAPDTGMVCSTCSR